MSTKERKILADSLNESAIQIINTSEFGDIHVLDLFKAFDSVKYIEIIPRIVPLMN